MRSTPNPPTSPPRAQTSRPRARHSIDLTYAIRSRNVLYLSPAQLNDTRSYASLSHASLISVCARERLLFALSSTDYARPAISSSIVCKRGNRDAWTRAYSSRPGAFK